jgi:ATP-dependent helicase/nuclease subunit B
LPNASPTSPNKSVFTIAAGVSFVDALAATLLDESRDDPLALTRYTILLPTRRARRSLADAFLRQSDGRPLLLPRMMPLGDLDPDEAELFGGDEILPDGEGDPELPPPIPALRRQLLLMRAILAANAQGTTADQAARLAAELARFLDHMQTEQVNFDRLKDLVPEEYAVHWQRTLRFLGILTENWPQILGDEGCIDPALRRNRVLEAQAEFWHAHPPEAPVIAAGSTGSIPATAALLVTIARLPNGRVVLPGLDRDADEAAWSGIIEDVTHPQHGMARLLQRFGLAPREVREWPSALRAAAPASRARVINEALRPAETTDRWHAVAESLKGDGSLRERFKMALRDLKRIDCANPQEEAQIIALQMRGALEEAGRRAALVTPDRGLARRVAAELLRWGIAVDDSAGQPLAEAPPGIFLRLALGLLAEDVAPAPLLALLKHPLAAAGMAPAALRQAARNLEIAVLRCPRPAPGFAGLRAVVEASDCRTLLPLVDRLARMAEPLARLLADANVPLLELIDAHIRFAEALAASDTESGAARLWAADAGEAAANFFAELRESTANLGAIPGRFYPALLQALIGAAVLRPRYGRHPRLAIWGPLEARLQHADLIIVGGLNEGTWPAEPAADPWLSRPMRGALGLAAPDRRIGLAAHDFAQALGAAKVVMMRSLRVEGTPTVPSRWLLRLDGFLRTIGIAPESLLEPSWRSWQATLDRPAAVAAVQRPAPCPPLSARPRRLSVTQVEVWRRDPYAIYARHILKLEALELLDAEIGAAERGIAIHQTLDEFVRSYPQELPDDALTRLVAIGEQCFGPLLSRPALWAFWWPRFLRIGAWFVAEDRARRRVLTTSLAEVKGIWVLETPSGPFTLTAKADRIDSRRDGTLEIIDYKTGTVPSEMDVASGRAPQLTLEAAMAAAGAFEDLPPGEVAALAYWRLSGGVAAGEIRAVKKDVAALAAEAAAGLHTLIDAFARPDCPYLALPDTPPLPRYNDYAHLERIKEWSVAADSEET